MECKMESSLNLIQNAQILSLDDNCLQQIFQCLQLHDLSNVNSVCKRFRTLAAYVVKSILDDQKMLYMSQMIEGNKEFHEQWFMVRWLAEKFMVCAERLFRNFGHLIKALHLTGTGEMGGMDENKLLLLVNTYCRASLQELTLVDFGRSDDFSTDELIPLFRGLRKLSICVDSLCQSFVTCLSDCQNLTHLKMTDVPAKVWINYKFSMLETLIISNNSDFDNTEFELFLKLHKNLRTLKYDDRYILSDFFSILSTASPELEKFDCNFVEILDYDDDAEEAENNILQLSKLQSLRNLTFTCEASTLDRLVAAFEKEHTPIEYLNLVKCEIESDLIVGISKIKSMKTLKLTRCVIAKDSLIDVNKHLNRIKVVVEDGKCYDIDGNNTEITLADNVCVVKTSIRKRPKQCQDSADILNILNDDCIVEIFELLPVFDLCNVAEVCKRFRENAQKAFRLHHTSFKTSELRGDNVGLARIDMIMAEKLFRNFGFFIHELKVEGHFFKNTTEQETIMFLATKYCISILFKTLTLHKIHINVEMRWIFPLLNMFARLPALELHSCRLNADFGKFLSICQILSIQVHTLQGSWEWMNFTFWHVRRMMLIEIWLPESAMKEFIKLNGHLQTLIIHQSNLSSKMFKNVANHMPNLQGFSFVGRNPRDRKAGKNVLNLARLKSLTRLSLNCGKFSLKNLIDELTKVSRPISELDISFGAVDMELFDKLHNFKSSLTNLQLRRVNMKNVSLTDVVKKIPELKELDIDIKGIVVNDIIKMLPFAEKLSKLRIGSERSNVRIDIDNYKSILAIVKSRHKSTKLCININSQNRNVFVPTSILQESIYWLEISNEINENFYLIISDSESENEELHDSDSDSSTDEDDGSVMSVEDSDVPIEMEID